MKKAGAPLRLSARKTDRITQGILLANRALRRATSGVTVDYDLGPRGAWIVRLIAGGNVIHPLDVTNFYAISRSVVTDELAHLLKSRLIVYRKSRLDGRRVELALTPLGEKLSQRVSKETRGLIARQLASFSREELSSFGRMLDRFATAKDPNSPPSKRAQPRAGRSSQR